MVDTPSLDFVIVGGQKCGSTSLHRNLAEHPEIAMPQAEVHLFEDPFDAAGVAPALARMRPQKPNARLFGVKRADYLADHEAAQRLHACSPDALIVAILRNPIERIVSAYFHFIHYGLLPVIGPERGLPRALSSVSWEAFPVGKRLARYGLYAQHLSVYRRLFGAERIHVCLFDDLRQDPLSTVQSVYRRLGVRCDYRAQQAFQKAQSVNYSLPLACWRRQRNRFVYEYDSTRTKTYTRRCARWERALVRVIDSVDVRLLAKVFDATRKPRLSADLRRLLLDLYADDIYALEAMLGRDLSHWKAQPSHHGQGA